MRLPACLALVLTTSALPAADAPVSYAKQILPIFRQNCQGCHQPAKAQGGYMMIAHADLFKNGEHEKAGVVPGKPAESYLVQTLRPGAEAGQMPKGKPPLPEETIKLVERWIAEGAKDDTPASARLPDVDAAHPPVYELPPVVTALAYSPDGTTLAASGYHEVVLHKADGSGVEARLVGLAERVQSIAYSPDGKTLAVCGGSPGRFGEIQLWDAAKKRLRLSISVTNDTVYGLSWSPDGSKVAVGCADNTLRAFDAKTGEQVLFQGAHSDWVIDTAFSGDGQHLASVGRDRSMKLTEVATQRFIDNVTSITPGALKGGLMAVAIRPLPATSPPRMSKVPPDTKDVPAKPYDELLTAGADGQPRLYKMHREAKRVIGDDLNKIRDYEKFPGRVSALAFSKDGTRFAAGSSLDGVGEVRVFEAETGKRLATAENVKTSVYAVAFHPEGKAIASAGTDGLIRLTDAATGKPLKEFPAVPLTK